MFRFLLYLLIIYFGFQVIKIYFQIKKRPRYTDESQPPFKNIEEAEFEDITHKEDQSENSDKNKSDK